MNYDDELIKNKLFDLANKSYSRGISTNSRFLNLHEQEIYNIHSNSLSFASPNIFGGSEECERKIVFFNDENYINSISLLKITAKNQKFTDTLTHRDFLGAILNLGIEYNLIGDILIQNNTAFMFCLKEISNYITENLIKVKHTTVKTEELNLLDFNLKKNYKLKTISVNSLRIDAIISKIYNLDRETSKNLILKNMVFVNDYVCKETSKNLKQNDIVSVRGYGKFKIDILDEFSKPHLTIKIYNWFDYFVFKIV